VSAGWNLHKEAIMEDVDWVNNLKVRLGWGQTSNQSVDPYATLGLLSVRPYNFGTATTIGAYVSSVPNDGVGWEYSRTSNVGIYLTIVNQWLTDSIESAHVDTNDLLMRVNLHCTSGVASYCATIGKPSHRGIEVPLNRVIIDYRDGWNWVARL